MHTLWNRFRMSINSKFIATFVVFLIIPFVILGNIYVYHMHSILMNKEIQYVQAKIDFTKDQIKTIILEMNGIIASMVLNHDVLTIMESTARVPTYEWFQDYKSIKNILHSSTNQTYNNYHITVIGSNGKSYSTQSADSVLSTDHPLIKKILAANGDFIMINRKAEGVDDRNIITVGKAIKTSGAVIGVIFVDLLPESLDNIFDVFDWDENIVYLYNSTDHPLYSSTESFMFPVLPENLQQITNQGYKTVYWEGTEYLCQNIPIPGTDCTILSMIAANQVFQESKRVTTLFMMVFLMIILATLLMTILVSTRISYNIKALNTQVGRFGDSDYHMDKIPRSKDEVGQLAKGFVAMAERIRTLLAQVKESETNKRRLEFQALQTQINPHMIYNTLNTITNLAQLQGVQNIAELSSSFAGLLRLISKNPGEFITIQDELEYVKAYIDIKKYNLYWEIQTDIQVDPTALSLPILKLVLQPLVENALVHAFSKDCLDCLLGISISLQDDTVSIDIRDNGCGMDEKRVQQILSNPKQTDSHFISVGITNTMQRLKLQYGDKTVFAIYSESDLGTHIHIEYPGHPIHL